MKKQFGIWLDRRKAYIIALKGQDVEVTVEPSEIEEFHPVGGSRSKSAWGPMDKVSESKYLERKKHQQQDYFKKLGELVKDGDEVFLFGPAETKKALLHFLENDKSFRPQLVGMETADTMTENQMVAKVKAFFKIE